MAWTMGEVAELAHVTVRSLHHYDRIGLFSPTHRTDAGYRLYGRADLARLQQVLFFRELGFPLRDIRRIMTARDFDARAALATQRGLLGRKVEKLTAMIRAVDQALAGSSVDSSNPDAKELFDMFDGFDPKAYEAEVEQRWGPTPSYKESARRTANYSKDQWAAIKAEDADILAAWAAAMGSGAAATDPAATDVAERHRQHIARWYYTCPHEMHVCLGRMYVDDLRFAARYEAARSGLAAYVRDAIAANANRNHG